MSKDKILLNLLEEDANIVNNNISLKVLEGKSVTVTGATGLIGLNIVSALVYYNDKYASKSIHINAVSYTGPSGAILELFDNGNVISICGDIANYKFMKTIPDSDYIIHGACYGQPAKFTDDKIKTISINTSTTIELIKKLKSNGHFLFLSSSEVYSGSPSLSNIEDDIGTTNPGHPRACYIEGKRTGEAIVNAARMSGINAVSARLALVYGPGVKRNDMRVLSQLIEKGIQGEINLLDDGNAVRTYGYISDIVVMLFNILIKNESPVYNVSGKSIITIKNLALEVGKKMNVPVNIPDMDAFMSEAPEHVELNLAKVEAEYGNREFLDLNFGLIKTIKWIKSLR
jgi:nucleoside-diphosphate-sugar epimerase